MGNVDNEDDTATSSQKAVLSYEQDGQLNLIPWDYNESFSARDDVSALVNFPIDTPFTIDDLSQRRFFMVLLENETYLAQYHEYLRQLCEGYVQGEFEEKYNKIRSQIDDLVKEDPTLFSTYEEYDQAAQTVKQLIEARAQSVLGQLNGTIPSTKEGQSEQPELLLDVSDIKIPSSSRGFGMKRTVTK